MREGLTPAVLSSLGSGCGRTRGGRGLRDRVDSMLGLLDLLDPARDGLTRAVLPSRLFPG